MLVDVLTNSIVLNLLALVFYSAIMRSITGFSLVVIGTVLIEMVHYALMEFLSGPFAPQMSYHMTLVVWYLGFASGDFLLVWLVLKLAKVYELNIERPVLWILGIYCAMGSLQVARLAERITIDTDVLEGVYKYGIKSLNLALSACLLGYVAYSAYHAFRYRNEYE